MPTERTLRDTTRRVIGFPDKYAAFRHHVSLFSGLPALRGLWTANHLATNGDWEDWTKYDLLLTAQGSPGFNYDGLASYVTFDGSTDYFTRADEAAISITGTESHIDAAIRGLTLGTWVYSTDSTNAQILMAKWHQTGNQFSYVLYLRGDIAGDVIQFYISDDGFTTAAVTGDGYTTSRWHFVVARFNNNDAGEELAIWLDNSKTTATTVMAAMFDSTADLYVGKYQTAASQYLAGRMSIAFLCAAALPDDMIGALFQQSRALYGV